MRFKRALDYKAGEIMKLIIQKKKKKKVISFVLSKSTVHHELYTSVRESPGYIA